MALFEDTLFGHEDKVQKAIDRLKAFEPKEGYYLAFSGGKDSQCIYHLAKMAGVKFDAHYSITSVDPPELMRFVREQYQDVEWERHYWNDDPEKHPEHYFPSGKPRQITMWNIIADHTIPPTRQARYCCSALKESGGGGRLVVTGVRWAESVRRKALHGIADIQTTSKKLHREAMETNATAAKVNKNGGLVFMDDNGETRRMVEHCYLKRKTTINPIVDWSDEDVWEFLNEVAKVPHCCLYDEGFTRLGCIGCPLQGREGMLADFERWPGYKEQYIRAFDKMIKNHPGEIKVASGELAETNGGGVQRYTQVGSRGTTDGDGSGHATDRQGEERERDEAHAWTNGQDSRYTTSGCGASERTQSGDNRLRIGSSRTGEEQARQGTPVVADDDGGGELRVLDEQLLTGGAPHTHTGGRSSHTKNGTERNCSNDGCGCTDREPSGTNRSRSTGSAIPDILAVEVSGETVRRGTKAFNPDPRVADYESGGSLFSAWVGGVQYPGSTKQ